ALARDARREAVRRHHVGALGEDRHAVDDERETAAPLIFLAAYLDAAQSRIAGSAGQYLVIHDHFAAEVVHVRLAVSGRPPALRMLDVDGNGQGVVALLERDFAGAAPLCSIGRGPGHTDKRPA